MTLYFAVISFPAIFSIEYTDKFMSKNSFGYDAIKWVNKTVPQNAKIISGLRSNALLQNEVVPTDWLSYGISKSELSGFENIVIKKKNKLHRIERKNERHNSNERLYWEKNSRIT